MKNRGKGYRTICMLISLYSKCPKSLGNKDSILSDECKQYFQTQTPDPSIDISFIGYTQDHHITLLEQ